MAGGLTTREVAAKVGAALAIGRPGGRIFTSYEAAPTPCY